MSESEGSWRPIWIRGGKIENIAWIGKDVLAWCSGMHIVFYNIPQRSESLRWCSKTENGEGVSCLSGHPTIHLLAFADKNFTNPKIFVLSYPSMNTVSECVQGSKNGYLATAFTSAEYLVSLGSYPTYSLIIWSWKTGERLAMIDTPICDMDGQIIRVSQTKPCLIAQLGRHSRKLYIWETSPAGKTILLTDHQVVLPGAASPFHMDWSIESQEPQLAIIDDLGNIYLANEDGSEVTRIVLTQRCGICLEYEAPSVRWFRDGIVLRTTFCQIRFFKKDAKNFWRKNWYVKSSLRPWALSVHPLKKDRLFYHTHEGFLMELKVIAEQEDPVIERRLQCGGIYKFVEFVHPWGHHLLALDDPVEMSILDCYDGREVARLNLELEGEITQLSSHPDYPMAAVTTQIGELVILSLHSPESPFIIAKYRLQSDRLDLIRFSQCGKYLIVGQRTLGICYCISLMRSNPFAIIARLKTKCRMTDVLLYDNLGHLKLLVLVVSSKQVTVGHHLMLYDIQTGGMGSIEPIGYLVLPGAYQFLHYAPKGPHFLIATPYLSRQIHLLEIKNWQEVNLVDAMFSGHDVRRARLWTNRAWITSAAFDGLVTLRNGKTQKLLATLHSCHRRDLGVIKAIVNVSGDIIVALGHDGSLVGTRSFPMAESTAIKDSPDYCRVDFGEYDRKKGEIMADYSSLNHSIVEILTTRIGVFPPVEKGAKKTWIQWSQEAKALEEYKEYYQEKMSLQVDFAKLRGRLVELLNDNEACPEIEKLPISAFDLDNATRDSRLKSARDEREDARQELESNCVSMDRVTSWILSTLWDPQKIVGRSIFSISGNIEVTNYPTTGDNPYSKEILQLARFYRDSMNTLIDGDTFIPWKLYTPSKLQLALNHKTRLHRSDETQRMRALLMVDENGEQENGIEDIEDRCANEGVTLHRFVEPSKHYYTQFELYGFAHLLNNYRNVVNDCKTLRDYFNKLFDEMYSSKDRAMSVIRERHERIRYIDSELRIMFGQSVSNLPLDPDWKWKEQPDGIPRVLANEVKVQPYVTQSQQELLDKQALEAERLRQILLADDFREKTLIKMMDGVLEVRWEDIIKRDVPKPQCLLEKEPDNYNAEDLAAIHQYEKDVEHLASERTRYHRMLEIELTKIAELLRETVDKFNANLQDLFLQKMCVEAAIQQLNLRNIRNFIRHFSRMKDFILDDEITGKITLSRKIIGRLTDEIRTLQALSQEYKNLHEALMTRERTIEKKFRSDFPSLEKSKVEILEREYKRRPRTQLKNATAGDLVELGRYAAARIKVPHLSHECAEYLKNLDNLDVRPAALPGNIDNQHWIHLTHIRRNKIELEMKTRAQMAEVHETEKTITEHEKKSIRLKSAIDRLKERLILLRQERIDFDLDAEIQLVLKMGQVEVTMSNRRDDMRNSVLITRKEIETINETIVNAGDRKLKTMNHTINFRRGTLFKEWEHKCLRMKIDDLEEDFRMIENVLVTRDMRRLINERIDKSLNDRTVQRLEKEFEATRRNCQKHLEDWIVRLEDIETKITSAKSENDLMDRRITRMNVDRWKFEWQRDVDGETKQRLYQDRVMSVVMERSRIVRKLHKEFAEVSILQTEHELLRLKKFPTLNFFKTLNDEPDPRR